MSILGTQIMKAHVSAIFSAICRYLKDRFGTICRNGRLIPSSAVSAFSTQLPVIFQTIALGCNTYNVIFNQKRNSRSNCVYLLHLNVIYLKPIITNKNAFGLEYLSNFILKSRFKSLTVNFCSI